MFRGAVNRSIATAITLSFVWILHGPAAQAGYTPVDPQGCE